MNITAKTLRKRRKALGLTQGQLGELAGFTLVTICHYETGRQFPLSSRHALDNVLSKLEQQKERRKNNAKKEREVDRT